MITARDYKISLAVGLAIGILLTPILFILHIVFPYRAIITIALCMLAMPAGLWFGSVLQRYLGFGVRFSKYAAGGLLSFSIDFAVLNIMSYMTGVAAGLTVGWINMPGFFLATINAYFFNKLWVFGKNNDQGVFAHLPKFLFVVFIGIMINSSVVVVVSTHITPLFGMSPQRWLNIAKIVASGVAIMWNFYGYKHIAFKE